MYTLVPNVYNALNAITLYKIKNFTLLSQMVNLLAMFIR